jgi:hypothetical protein
VKLIQEKDQSLVTIVRPWSDHVLHCCPLESTTEMVDKSGRSHIPRTGCRPEAGNEFLIGLAEGCILMISIVNPAIGMLVKEYGEICDVTETLENCIEIASISEICESNLSLLCILGYNRRRLIGH